MSWLKRQFNEMDFGALRSGTETTAPRSYGQCVALFPHLRQDHRAVPSTPMPEPQDDQDPSKEGTGAPNASGSVTPIRAQARLSPEIVEAAAQGDETAQALLFRSYAKKLYGLAKSLVRNHEVAEDILQDSFIYAFEHMGQLREPAAVGGWLARIVTHRSMSFLRREQIRRRIGLSTVVPESEYAVTQLPGFSVGADMKDARYVLNKLPVELRTLWWLKEVEGYTVPEIAKLAGISLDQAKKRIMRAERKLDRYRNKGAK